MELNSSDSPQGANPPLEHCFHRVVEQSPSSIVVTDTEGNIQYVNPAFERQTGYERAEVIGQNPRVLNAQTQSETVYTDLWQTISQGHEWTGRLHNRRKDGTLYWEKAVIAPILDPDGTIIQFIAIKEDITRLREAEEQNRWLGALMRSSPDICAVRDLQNRLIAVNDAFLRACGEDDYNAVAGRTDAEIFQLDRDGNTIRTFQLGLTVARELPPGQSHNAEIEWTLESGDTLVHAVSFLPIHDENDQLVAIATIAQDITRERLHERELTQALEQAEEASKAKSVFLGTVSHELRTPLNAIIGLTATLRESADIPAETRHSIEWVQRSGELLLSQIEGLLQFTRLQAGETHIGEEPFDLLQCLSDAVRFHRDPAREKQLRLDYDFDPRLPHTCVGDENKTRRILTNLLTNAIKFTPKGSVRLEASLRSSGGRDDPWMCLRVIDTGIGIPAEDHQNIFKPFFQVDGTDTRRHGGAGLGLSITEGLVSALGGTLRLQSVVGEGTSFEVVLPLREPSRATLCEALPWPSFPNRRFWLVGSPEGDLARIAGMIERKGAKAHWVAPAETAEIAESARPGELIAVDFGMLKSLSAHALYILDRAPNPILWVRSERPLGLDSVHPEQFHLPTLVLPSELSRACGELLGSAGGRSKASTESSSTKLADRLPLKILVVDDLESNRIVISTMLQHHGYIPDLAENGQLALEAVREAGDYDVVFMDLQMPVMDGFEATRKIRQHFPDLAAPTIIALTANAENGVESQCLEAGMSAYLSKPTTPRQIATALSRERGEAPATAPAPVVAKADISQSPFGPIIDQNHLDTLASELGEDAMHDLIENCFESFIEDCGQVFPRLQQALAETNVETTIALIHGLKGGASMLGLGRFRATCQDTLQALRENRFTGWNEFLEELQFLFHRSIESLRQTLAESRQTTPLPSG